MRVHKREYLIRRRLTWLFCDPIPLLHYGLQTCEWYSPYALRGNKCFTFNAHLGNVTLFTVSQLAGEVI